jgi:hypothetical protein
MSKITSFFTTLESQDKHLFEKITTNRVPDGTKLRSYLNENNVESKGSSMMFLVEALSTFLLHGRPDSPPHSPVAQQHEEKEEKVYSVSCFDPIAVQALSFEFEVLHGVYKAGKPDESRQKALEDAHVKCDQALEFIVEVKNTSDDFSAIIGGVTYAADTPSLANALFELYLQLN